MSSGYGRRYQGRAEEWKTHCCKACCERPKECAYQCLCMPCGMVEQRKRLAMPEKTPYVCCAMNGAPCCPECDWCCVWAEAFLCTQCMFCANRRLMYQTFPNLKWDVCEACLYCFTFCCTDDSNKDLMDLIWCAGAACFNTQNEIEMDSRNWNPPPKQAMIP
eukprot:TRINITY_DN7585_c0_g1_i1.p1 TRINITY_DN7585_c0_g1~~TRINITY_DN7585_c0_g1_i1.p1  ORF type:complete len:162 (-),score=19.12 TRINITY_DN7585_c0_g1_i1:118-603(-)